MVSRYLIEDAQIEPKVTLLVNEKGIEFTLHYVTDTEGKIILA